MANISRYNTLEDIFNGINDIGKGFFVRPLSSAMPSGTQQPGGTIRIDVREDKDAFAIRADIPGVKKEDIQVEVDDDLVSIRAEARQEREEKQGEKVVYTERSYGMASRSFTLPGPVDDKNAKADYKDGVLTLVLPKKLGAGGKRIPVG